MARCLTISAEPSAGLKMLWACTQARTTSVGSLGSSAVTVQSRYSWIVAALGLVAFFVPGRGGGA